MAYRVRESGIQLAILHYLNILEQQKKIYFFRNNSFAGFIQRSDKSVGHINNGKPGMPDIIICHNGRFIGIEVKAPKSYQSWKQKAAQEAIEAAGGLYILARDITDVSNVIF